MTFAHSVQTMYSLMCCNPLALQIRNYIDMVSLIIDIMLNSYFCGARYTTLTLGPLQT